MVFNKEDYSFSSTLSTENFESENEDPMINIFQNRCNLMLHNHQEPSLELNLLFHTSEEPIIQR